MHNKHLTIMFFFSLLFYVFTSNSIHFLFLKLIYRRYICCCKLYLARMLFIVALSLTTICIHILVLSSLALQNMYIHMYVYYILYIV